MNRPRFVVADTMDLWIQTARPDLDALLRRVNLLILNDSEAREITKETSLVKAGRNIRKMGPDYVAIKKGEHGALLFGGGDQFFSCGAYPLEDIHDPTGAGDTFAGGMAGYLAGTVKKVHFNDLRRAMIYGSVLASFCVEAFSLERLRTLSIEEVAKRYETFKLMERTRDAGQGSCCALAFICSAISEGSSRAPDGIRRSVCRFLEAPSVPRSWRLAAEPC